MINADERWTGSDSKSVVEGVDILDIEQLPPAECKLARLLLRQGELSEPLLRQANAGLDRPIAARDFDSALEHLVARQIILPSVDEPATYRLNLRRKRERSLSTNIWDRLKD